MWIVNGQEIKMTEGDYGIILPIKIKGATFGIDDHIQITIKTKKNDTTPILSKSFEISDDNIVNIVLTEAETNQLPIGNYVYSLDWYKTDSFMCNLILIGDFIVLDKA